MMKPADKWVFWTYACNGWKWAVLRGAELIEEGCCRTRDEANALADAVLVRVNG